MRDPLDASRLPDLPDVGYATTREKALSDAIMFFIRGQERDRVSLLSMVIDGREKFRRVIKKAWRSMKADDETADVVFGYLVLLAGADPEKQLEALLLHEKYGVFSSFHG